MTTWMDKLDKDLKQSECEKREALNAQRKNREVARNKGIHTKVSSLRNYLVTSHHNGRGSAEYNGLTLTAEGNKTILTWNCRVVFSMSMGWNIIQYCEGAEWERKLHLWHNSTASAARAKKHQAELNRRTAKVVRDSMCQPEYCK